MERIINICKIHSLVKKNGRCSMCEQEKLDRIQKKINMNSYNNAKNNINQLDFSVLENKFKLSKN